MDMKVSFKPRPLYSGRLTPLYPVKEKRDEPQSLSIYFLKKKMFFHFRESNHDFSDFQYVA
jgi:hypothetical protein